MSISHGDIETVADAHPGILLSWTTRSGGTGEGLIPNPFDGELQHADGTLFDFPVRGERYTAVNFMDHNRNILQTLAPARSGSAERAILAQMLAAAEVDRRAQAQAAAEQRQLLLEHAQRVATEAATAAAAAQRQAEAQRLALFDEITRRDDAARLAATTAVQAAATERTQMLSVIQAVQQQQQQLAATIGTPLSATSQALFNSPGSHVPPTPSVTNVSSTATSTTSVMALPPDYIEMLKRREQAESKFFSSWQNPGEHFTDAQKTTLKMYFPEYKWLKSDPQAPSLRQALRHVADSHLTHGKGTHEQHLQAIIANITAAGNSATREQAAELQAMMGIAASASGTMDWPRVILCELAILGARNLQPAIISSIKAARAVLADDTTTGVDTSAACPSKKVVTRNAMTCAIPRNPPRPLRQLASAAHARSPSPAPGPRSCAPPATPAPPRGQKTKLRRRAR